MLLEVRNAQVRYGAMLALENVSINVARGTLVALVGANGAGKTTLLKAISGLVGLAKGEILFDGQRISGKSAYKIARAGIGHVPEGRGVLPEITVAENFQIGAYQRLNFSTVAFDQEKVLELFPSLKRRWRQPASVLSGGEQQMLSIGRALMKRPTLLIVDEMSLGLAPIIVHELMAILCDLVAQGLTVLCVEQNTGLVLQHAAYAYVLQNGSVAHEGPGPSLLAEVNLHSAYLGKSKTPAPGGTGERPGAPGSIPAARDGHGHDRS